MRHDVIKPPSLYTSAGRHLGLLRLGVAVLYVSVLFFSLVASWLEAANSWQLKSPYTCISRLLVSLCRVHKMKMVDDYAWGAGAA